MIPGQSGEDEVAIEPTGQRARSASRPTLDQVAARAGVGRGTVSRVVNGSSQVSAQAKAAVEQAIQELGYVPNRAARALVTRRTDSVALVVCESSERVFGEPFFAGIVRGINSLLLHTPLQLWLAMAGSMPERERVRHRLTAQHVDGVLLLSAHADDPLPSLVAKRGLPIVVCGQPADTVKIASDRMGCVDADDAGGARAAVAHLLARGRRRIVAITPPPDRGDGQARLAGYHSALRAARLAGDDSLIGYGDRSVAGGAGAMRLLLDRHPDLDAVFATSDLAAVGAMRVLRDHGRRIPVDVSVVGFEDALVAYQPEPALTTPSARAAQSLTTPGLTRSSALTTPPAPAAPPDSTAWPSLTTVQQPALAMGREMARLLLAYLRGEPVQAPQVVLDTHLVIRLST